jgi:hypothetical protein
MRRTTPATIALVAALSAGCGGAGKPHFQSAVGWQLLSDRNDLAAANVPFAAADRRIWPSPPSRTVATLPRRGVVIWAMVSRSPGPGSTPLPLRLTEAQRSNPFEGFGCAPAVSATRCYAESGSIRRLGAQVGPYYVDAYVFFGTDRPEVTSIAAANAELARFRFPGERSATSTPPVCPTRAGNGAYRTTLDPSAGPPGSTVTVSGALGVMNEDGTYGGQTARDVDAYWNLDFRKWWTGLERSPLAAVAGSPVRHLGSQDVAKRCRYRFQVSVPSLPPGRYPIEVLYGNGKNRASFAPVDFRVTPR